MRTIRSTWPNFAALLRRCRAVVVVGALSTVLVATAPGVAHAGLSQVSDGFEVNPVGAWLRATGGNASAGFDINQGTARSGRNNGWLFAVNGWAYEGFWVPTNAAASQAAQCAAQFYVHSSGPAQVGIEIWDAHAHLLSSTYPFVNGNGYQEIHTNRWPLNRVNPVFVKVIIGSNGAAKFVRVDDMTLQCSW